MTDRIRVSQVYELQRVALINVHYYAARITTLTRTHRRLLLVGALASSGTIASVIAETPGNWRWISIPVSIVAAAAASFGAVYGYADSIARAERMHAAYKMLYHSVETLAKQVIGRNSLTEGQQCVLTVLESQLAALGPQDEIDPNKAMLDAAQLRVESQLTNDYYYPDHARQEPASEAHATTASIASSEPSA